MSSSVFPSFYSGTLGVTWQILAEQLWVERHVTSRLRLLVHFCFPTHYHLRGHTLQIPQLQDGLGSKQETNLYLVNPWDFKVLFVVAARTIYPNTSWNSHSHRRLWLQCCLKLECRLETAWKVVIDHEQLNMEVTWLSKRRCLHRNHLLTPKVLAGVTWCGATRRKRTQLRLSQCSHGRPQCGFRLLPLLSRVLLLMYRGCVA